LYLHLKGDLTVLSEKKTGDIVPSKLTLQLTIEIIDKGEKTLRVGNTQLFDIINKVFSRQQITKLKRRKNMTIPQI